MGDLETTTTTTTTTTTKKEEGKSEEKKEEKPRAGRKSSFPYSQFLILNFSIFHSHSYFFLILNFFILNFKYLMFHF